MKIYNICIFFLIGQIIPLNAQNRFYETDSFSDTTVRYGKLKNGFSYYLKQNDNPPGHIEMILSVKAGTYQENENQKEYAHLLEHLGTFNTGKFPQLRKYADSVGIYNYAKTGYDNTYYTLSLEDGDQKRLDAALTILREWTDNISLNAEDVRVQGGAVIAEGRSKAPYLDWLSDTLSNTILSNTNFDILDKVAIIKSMRNINLKALKSFYKKWYRPDLEAAIIVGDINVDSLETVIRDRFSHLKKWDKSENPDIYNRKNRIKLSGSNQYISINDSINKQPRIYVINKRINRNRHIQSDSDLKEMLLQQLSIKILSEIGGKLLKQYNPPYTDYLNNFKSNSLADSQLQTSFWEIPLDDDTNIRTKLVRFFAKNQHINNSINEQILLNYKNIVLNELISQSNTSEKIALKLHEHFVSGSIYRTSEKWKRMINKILSEIEVVDIRNYIENEWNFTENTDFIFINKGQNELPDHDKMIEWLVEGRRRSVHEKELVFKQIDSLPNIFSLLEESNLRLPKKNIIGVSEITTSNGIRLVFKPSKPATTSYRDKVSIFGYKSIAVPINDSMNYITATLAPDLMFNGDVGNYTKFEIEDYMQEKGMSLNYYYTSNEFNINGKFKNQDVEDFFKVFYLYITDPTKNETAFEIWKKNRKLELNASKPYNLMIKDFTDRYRYTKLPDITTNIINNISYPLYSKAYKNWFSNLKGYTFIITGDFKTEKLLPKINQFLSEFPTSKSNTRNDPNGYFYNYKKISKTIRYQNTVQAVVELSFPVKVEKDIKTQVELDLLANKLHQMIYDRLRIGSYSPYASGKWMDYKNGIYAFNISFNCDIEKKDQMINYALEEFRKLKENSITQRWLETTIRQKSDKYDNKLETFWLLNFWTKYLKNSLQRGVELENNVLKYETVLSHFINLEDLNLVAKKYLTEEKRQDIIILPKWVKDNN